MKKGRIIYLNGVGGAGKTTLSRKLQEHLSTPFYWLSFDYFLNISPERYLKNQNKEARAIMNKSASMLPHTVKSFSDKGLDVIADGIYLEIDNLLEGCVELLHDYPVMFVHVTCPLEELYRRATEERGIINPEENIHWQLSELIPKDADIYDLTVDTTKEDSIDKIIRLLDYPDKFTAFKILYAQRTK